MSTQTQVNSYYQEYILYYCNSVKGDPTVYDYIGLTNVCSVAYDSNTPPQVVISGWLIGGYTQPTNAMLLTYVFSTVDAFYQNFYIIPTAIQLSQPYQITTSNLANVIPHSNMLNFTVFDTTAHTLKYWNGSTWVTSGSGFLKKDGTDSMAGNLNIGNNNIINANNISQTTPSAISIWSSAVSALSFTANTPQVVSLGSFSQTINPNSDFTFNSSTGQITYTGSVTRYFRINISYSITSLAIASVQTNFISKNNSTTISSQRAVNSYLLLGPVYIEAYSISDIVQLANNNTIQLAAQSSSTSSVTYGNVGYSINAL